MDRSSTRHSEGYCQSSSFVSPFLRTNANPSSQVVLNPSNGADTQRYFLTPAEPDIVHHVSSAKFSAKKPVAEDCGHKWSQWSIYRPVEIMLQYLPSGAH